MVAAAYEIDYQINQEMQHTGQQNATDNVLLRQSDSILRQTELSEYKIIENLSDKQYLVLEEGSDVKVVFRGRAGDNHADNTHVSDTLRGKVRDYGYINDLMAAKWRATAARRWKLMTSGSCAGALLFEGDGCKGRRGA